MLPFFLNTCLGYSFGIPINCSMLGGGGGGGGGGNVLQYDGGGGGWRDMWLLGLFVKLDTLFWLYS